MEGGELLCLLVDIICYVQSFCILLVSNFILSYLARRTVSDHHAARRPAKIYSGVWYEHDVTSDDEAEENQEPTAEDQDGEGSGNEDVLEESYDESD